MFKFITHRPLWVNVLVALLLVAILTWLFFSSLNCLTRHGESKTVPSVTGKSFSEAKKILLAQGFDVVVQDSSYYDTLPKLSVVSQVPEGNTAVKINRTVYLRINRSEPPYVNMPNLVGFSFRNAEMILKNAGLRIGDTSRKPDFARNSILEQSYKGNTIIQGTKIKMGSSVDLVLGDGVGDRQFPVPVVVGMTYADAKEVIESKGLSFGARIAEGNIKDTMSAYIIWQDPQKFDDEKKMVYIRSGQMINVRFSAVRKVNLDTVIIDNENRLP
jgi:eukaryotic-like serine/threonine-protein kinase